MSKYSGNVHIVYDGMWGSCGKGKFVGLLARNPKMDIKVSINNNAPNAGHSFVFDDGRKVVTTHLPTAVVNPNIPILMIGESAVINIDTLEKELQSYSDLIGDRKIYIHQNAAIVLQKHIEEEKATLTTGSTLKGSGAALVDKLLRRATLAGNTERLLNNPKIEIVSPDFLVDIYNGRNGFKGNENILVEMSQGVALSINSGFDYPYTTSRECTPNQAKADIHCPPTAKVTSYCVFRPYPIRINNQSVTGEHFTGFFGGATEKEWKIIAERCGMPEDLIKQIEQTTVTKRLRRVSEFCIKQFERMLLDTQPDHCFLNFAEYVNYDLTSLNSKDIKKIQKQFASADWFAKVSNEEFENNVNKCLAIDQLKIYIDQLKEFYSERFNDSSYLNISLVGTGAKENEVFDNRTTQYSNAINLKNAVRDWKSPLDYAKEDKAQFVN